MTRGRKHPRPSTGSRRFPRPPTGSRRLLAGRAPYVWAVGALLLLVAAAAGVPETWPFARSEPAQVVVPDPPAALPYILVAIALATLVVAVAVGVPGHPRRRRGRAGSTWAVVLVVALALWAASPAIQAFTARVLDNLTVDRNAANEGERSTTSGANGGRGPRSVALGYALTVMVAAAGILLLATLWWSLRRGAIAQLPENDDAVGLEVDASIDDLVSIRDPRAAVLACYGRLQRLAATSGVATSPADAPFELLDRMLAARRVSSPAARRLTVLFEHARFSPRLVDENMRRRAIQALTDVRKELDGA